MSQSLTSFADLIRSAERSALHVEMRDTYSVESERERSTCGGVGID